MNCCLRAGKRFGRRGREAGTKRKRHRFVFANFAVPVFLCGRQFVLTNFRVFGVEGRFGQLVCGLRRRFAELVQAVAGFQRDGKIGIRLVAALALGDVQVFQHPIAQAAGVKLGNVFVQQLDGGVYLAVESGLVAQDGIEPVQPFGFGERVVFKELGLPAVEAAQTPGSRRDLLCLRHYFVSDVMLL